jgi:serine/threonine protein kinase
MQGETMNWSSQPPSCGSWRLEREIGHGAYGVVYLAFSPDGEPAAVKVCRRDAVDPERYSRELRGAKLYCAVPQKEGLVWMRAFAETEWGFYAVMDLADDEFGRIEVPIESYRPKTLASVIKGEKALPLKECVNLAIFLARGLAALQLHHLLHRDIKPANVLYVCGRPVLSDPGLVVDESEAASFVGTPGYVPPEKFTDAASDVYSLGLTLKAASFGRQIEDIDKGPALEADTGAPLFPAWWRILNKATDPTPSRRYQSAKALVKDLERLRWRMSWTLLRRSWLFYTVVGILLSCAVAYMYVVFRKTNGIEAEIKPLKEFKNGMEEQIERSKREAIEEVAKAKEGLDGFTSHLNEMVEERKRKAERIKRDSFWVSSQHAFNAYTDGISDNARLEKKIACGIAEIKAINKANSEQLQAALTQITNIAAKEEALDRKIESLHKKAEGKLEKELDDKEEYLQAKILNENRVELHKSLQNTVADLNTAETNMLERINRDWFWDLHNSGTCRLDSESIIDCIKRSIAVKEARIYFDYGPDPDRKKSLVKWYNEHFENFVKHEEIHALARQKFARLMKLADEKTNEGLDDSAELLELRRCFFRDNFYYNHLINTTHLNWLLKTSFSDRVQFDYGFYDARNFCLRLESYMDLFRREITTIAEEDKKLGEKLRSDFDKLGKLLAKESSYQKDIDILHENACKKKQNGLDDAEEFLQAQKIAEEAKTFHKKELEPLASKLYCRMRDYKRKKSRWGDLYGYRHYSLDFELMKRGIKEVSAFSEKTASRLQKELDILAKGNARAMVFQKEIDSLRKKGKEKLQNGQDDAEEYTAAKRIFDKERSLYIYDVGNKVNYDMFNSLVSEVCRRTVSPVRWSWADKSGK